MDEARIDSAIDAIYDGAVMPGQWPALLSALAGLFNCHFGDTFARSHDRRLYKGLAIGLDADD